MSYGSAVQIKSNRRKQEQSRNVCLFAYKQKGRDIFSTEPFSRFIGRNLIKVTTQGSYSIDARPAKETVAYVDRRSKIGFP